MYPGILKVRTYLSTASGVLEIEWFCGCAGVAPNAVHLYPAKDGPPPSMNSSELGTPS